MGNKAAGEFFISEGFFSRSNGNNLPYMFCQYKLFRPEDVRSNPEHLFLPSSFVFIYKVHNGTGCKQSYML